MLLQPEGQSSATLGINTHPATFTHPCSRLAAPPPQDSTAQTRFGGAKAISSKDFANVRWWSRGSVGMYQAEGSERMHRLHMFVSHTPVDLGKEGIRMDFACQCKYDWSTQSVYAQSAVPVCPFLSSARCTCVCGTHMK